MPYNVPIGEDPWVRCKCCGENIHRSATLAHAYWKHRDQFWAWHNSRIDFGFSAAAHVNVNLDEERRL
jgi:hypothetical protein